MIKCRDCNIEISEHATHTGWPTWCEDCFDKGLCKDMDEHSNNFFRLEMEEIRDDQDARCGEKEA